jgi:hypothetical protein
MADSIVEGPDVSWCLDCPRCGLSIVPRSPWLTINHCPRSLGRTRTLVELSSSELRAEGLYADSSPAQSDAEQRIPPAEGAVLGGSDGSTVDEPVSRAAA